MRLPIWATLLASLLVASPALADPIVLATGGTDAEVQAAVDSLGGPGVVLVPPGEYALSAPVNVTADDVTVLGSGSGPTKLVHVSVTSEAPFFYAQGVSGLRISGFHIQDDTSSGSAVEGTGIRVEDAFDFRIDHSRTTHGGEWPERGASEPGRGRDRLGIVVHTPMASMPSPLLESDVARPVDYPGAAMGICRTISMLLVAVTIAGACDSNKKEGDASAGSDGDDFSSDAPPKTYEASLDGKKLTFKSALASSQGGSVIKLSFSTEKMRCEDLASRFHSLRADEVRFQVFVAPRVNKGANGWVITKVYYSGNTRAGDLGEAKVKAKDVSKTVKVDFSYDITSAGKEPKKLKIKGPFELKGCGEVRKEDAPEIREQQLELMVGNEKLPIRGATVTKSMFGHELTLSSLAHDCNRTAFGEFVLTLTLDDSGKLIKVAVRGDLLTSQSMATSGMDELQVEADGLRGSGDVKVDLAGNAHGMGFSVQVNGKVTAKRCKDRQ
ncbi:MAG: hypothetical protein JRI68_11040 [Deltaproteobacteria bacterium]|nr:hypothetical protein [Deltaproteobacteria bacterium]